MCCTIIKHNLRGDGYYPRRFSRETYMAKCVSLDHERVLIEWNKKKNLIRTYRKLMTRAFPSRCSYNLRKNQVEAPIQNALFTDANLHLPRLTD